MSTFFSVFNLACVVLAAIKFLVWTTSNSVTGIEKKKLKPKVIQIERE